MPGNFSSQKIVFLFLKIILLKRKSVNFPLHIKNNYMQSAKKVRTIKNLESLNFKILMEFAVLFIFSARTVLIKSNFLHVCAISGKETNGWIMLIKHHKMTEMFSK